MSDYRSEDRDYGHDDRRDDRDDDRDRRRGHDRGDDHCDDHGQATAQVSAITALSADTGASHSDFITSQALQTVSGTFTGSLKSGELIQVSADGGAHWISASVSGNDWSASGVNLVSGPGTLITRTVDSQNHALAGASHDYLLDTLAAPPSLLASFTDTGASANDGVTSANKATLSGTAEAGATVRIYDGATLIATVTAAQNGTWSQSVKGLADGAHAFTAIQTDIAGNISAHSLAGTMNVDRTVVAPSLAADYADSGVSANDGITNATAATLSGTAEAGATVKVYDGSRLIGSVTADAGTGAWSFDATGLQDGTHRFSAKQTDLADNTSKSSDASAMTVDTTPPSAAPTLVAAFVDTGVSHTDRITSATTAELSGKADKGALVQIYDGSTLIGTVTAAKNGNWSYSAVNLPDGVHSFTAAQSDIAGNLSASSPASTMTVAALAPPPGVALLNDTGISDSDRITQDGTLKLSGVQAGASVQYSVDGGTSWTSSFAAHEGANNVQVRQTDVAGNVSSATTLMFTLDTSVAAPGVALDNDTGIAGDKITSDGALVLNGIESGARVEYSTDGGASWSTSFSAHEGVNSVQVHQVDLAGNTSSAATLNFTLDTVAAAPSVALANDTGFNGDNITSDGALAPTGIEPGATVQYSLDGGLSWTSSFTPVEGQNSVQLRQTDAAGNVSEASTLAFALDTHAPNAPLVALATDTGASSNDHVSKIGTLSVTPAEPGGAVQYSIDGGTTWSSSFGAHEGVNSLQLRQVDDAGNASAPTLFSFTLDTNIAAPHISAVVDDAGPVTGVVAVGASTDDTTPTLNGTAEANSTITVYDGPSAIGTATADAGGNWTFVPAGALAAGANHSFSVQAVDLAGNAAASNAYAITIGTPLHAPVLAPVAAQSYADGPGFETFSAASGTLNASETGVSSFSYAVTGAAPAAPIAGYDTAAAGQYGTVYLNGSSGAYEFVPDNAAINALPAGANQSDSFTFWVADGLGGTDSTTLAINLSGANDTPTLTASVLAKSYADTAAADVFAPVAGVLSASDADLGATHTYSVSGLAPAAATLAGYDTAAAGLYGTLYLNSSSGAYVFVPDNNAINALPAGTNPSDSFTLSVLDNSGGIDSKTLNIGLSGANDTPALSASLTSASFHDTSANDAFNPVTGTLTASDRDTGATHSFDLSGGSASTDLPGYDLAKLGAYGSLYLNSGSGAYTFVPDGAAVNALAAGANASDIFTLTVSDGNGGAASKALTINVQGANDAAVISGVTGPLNYSVGDAPVAVAPQLALGDVDSALATSATVAISAGFRAGNDTLSFTAPAGITGVYDNQTGILQFTGSASLTDYQTAMASVLFSTTTAGGRVISYTVFDNGVASATVDTSSVSLDVLTTTGFRAPGTYWHDFSGFSVHNAGDINGDGFADVIIGAPFADNGTGGGASFVIFGKDTSFGTEVPLATLGAAGETAGFRISAQNGSDAFGSSVSSAGDINGDGYADLIVGAPRAGAGGSEAGAAYVIFGHGNATPFAANLDLSTTPPDGSNGFTISGTAANDWAGYAVSTAGDLNGDGFADIVIGSHYAGAAYVVFGHSGATSFGTAGNFDLASLDGSNGFTMSTPASAVSVNSVSNAGDVNGDGFSDLIVSATLDNGSYYGAPAAYVVFGHAAPFGTGGNLNLSALNGSTGFSISSGADASRAQHTISSAGDVNGDGFADLIVGMPYASTVNGVQSGAAYVIFGHTAGFSPNIDVATLSPSTGFSITGAGASDWAGYSVSSAGDVNGDGYGDLIVGAPHALGAHASSESYVIFGQASGLLHNIDLSNLSPSDGFRLSGVGLGDASGYAVSAAGDVNGDGFGDLIVGAAYASPHGTESAGESYVVFGSKFIVGTDTYVGSSALHLLTGTAANDHFIAGSSSDTTTVGNGGVDSFSGGAGNDTLHLGLAGSSDSRFLHVEGGSGYDTLALDGSGMALNLTSAGVDGRIHGVERIDLGSGNNSLTLDIRDVLNMSPNDNQLFITGQSGSVSSLGQGWLHAPGGLVSDHGISYDSYTLGGVAYSEGMANLLVDHNLVLANAVHLS